MKGKTLIISTGAIVGLISVLLVYFGNPANMGFCIACFLRDIAGGLGLHQAEIVQYIRPEIIGLVLGAFIMAFSSHEFKSRGGSSLATRFILGFCMMIGALIFLGCPLRMMLRIAGGDLNAIVGLAGFASGIVVGIYFMNKGFSLKRTYSQNSSEGFIFPIIQIILFGILIALPALLIFSEKGPGSMRAPIIISLLAGLIVGALAQKSRLCTIAGIRDAIMFKDFHMLSGFITIILVALIGNIVLGYFKLGFEAQPVAHMDGIWNFVGMMIVGISGVLLGGCPLRQLILAGEGNTDSVITVFGLVAGAAFSHNFKLASSADGASAYGPYAAIFCLVVILFIGITNIQKVTKTQKSSANS